MPFSTSYTEQILNYTLSKIDGIEAPSEVYIGLCSNDPEADNGTFTELSGSGYSRVLISRKSDNYPNLIGTASNRTITNIAQINWVKATANWEKVNGFGLFTTLNSKSESPFFYGKLKLTEEQKAAGGLTVTEGEVALFEAESLQLSMPIVCPDCEAAGTSE
jgi:hypothetical protein